MDKTICVKVHVVKVNATICHEIGKGSFQSSLGSNRTALKRCVPFHAKMNVIKTLSWITMI